ncbi:MAG: CDP-diacylglycerol--glycerol-3-phosphate 3-phosphatidyltransferase [Candidatus Cloacimonetes bacterium]|nr:CDP-diacylglycerol--glycerol-3-phosphate 3-phosphatidyltransferase [Candidatus Cloacimonadota bacterium]
MKRHIPNFLTLVRIALVPIFIWLSFICKAEHHILWATIVFIVACITDFFDGMLARRFEVITNFGKFMDPLADKILVISALFSIALEPIRFFSVYIVYIILFREILITLLRNLYAKKGVFIAADIWGKLKTILQMTGAIAALVYYSIISKWTGIYYDQIKSGFNIAFWIIAFITILSGIIFISKIKTGKNHE